MRHRADQEPIEILLIFFTICLIQVADSWGKDGKGLFDMGWNGKSSSWPSRSLYPFGNSRWKQHYHS